MADSVCGKEACLTLPLAHDRAVVETLLDETNEALSLLEGRSGLSTVGLPDLRETLQRLRVGAPLSGTELLFVRSTLLIARQFRTSISLLPQESFPRLIVYLGGLPPCDKVLEEIENAIDDGGEVKDEASKLLRQLRSEVHRIDAKIKETLHKIIHSSTQSKALVEPLYTMRNGRYVLPVNASMRSSVAGIVHDSSASGMTVYVEPMAVLELSNKMRLKETEMEREIVRILEELSLACSTYVSEIGTSFGTIVELDVIMAKARLARQYRGTRPHLSGDSSFHLLKARHPLLVLQNQNAPGIVVANDITLGGNEARTLVITGPNTGGKTVLLKLVGIFAIMVRAGLMLPVSAGSSAAIFTSVCADIGDEQSLEQSLSTFSSHMKNVVEIIARCGQGWLILLDEVGAGTDPREGAALARAILEHLNQSGAVTISTTHYGELKTLAYTERGFLNGSLEFDEETLSPTYRLRLGVPGSSKATTIARRLGLDARVIDRACELIEVHEQDLQKTIDQLEVKLKEAQVKEEEAEVNRQEAQSLRLEAFEKSKEAQSTLHSAKQRQASEIDQDYQLGKDYIKQLIADLQKNPSISKAQKAQQDLERVKQELGWSDRSVKTDGLSASAPRIVLGETVKVISLNQRGIVSDVPADAAANAGALISVRCGAMKVKVTAADLEVIHVERQHFQQTPSAKKKRADGSHSLPGQRAGAPSRAVEIFVRTMNNTLDLRGQRVDDALNNLERFLDECSHAGVSPVMVIHGHGTGAVRNAVREHLRQSEYAHSFKPGEHFEGGDGVTLIQL